MKLTQEQREDFEQAMEHWVRVCKIADTYMDKPVNEETMVIVGDLKRAGKYIADNYGGWFWHPLMDCEESYGRY